MKYTKEQWQVIIKEQKESGLSMGKFCKSKNIPPSTFHSVLSRLEPRENKRFFTKVKLDSRVESNIANLKISFPQGIYIEFPIYQLTQVVEALSRGTL